MDVLGEMFRRITKVPLMIRRVLGLEHFTREIVDLSDAFKNQDPERSL